MPAQDLVKFKDLPDFRTFAKLTDLSNYLKKNQADTMSANEAGALLTVNQLGAGQIARFQQNNTNRVVIANNGQLQLTPVSGAALTVSNNTLITNLNADLLDGIEGTQYARKDLSDETFAGNVFLDADGSSTSAPRTIGFSDFSSGEACRFQIGDAFNSYQVSNGGRTIIQSFHCLRLYGHTYGSAAIGFESSNTSDPMVEIVGQDGSGNDVYDNPHLQVRAAPSEPGGSTVPIIRTVDSGGTEKFSVRGNGQVFIGGNRILTSRQSAVSWSGTGTADLTYDATERDMLNDLMSAVAQIISKMQAHGLIS